MTIREDFEAREKTFLSPFACASADSKGRKRHEEPCLLRTAFQRDRDRIVYSNAFRRLKHKTQVFLSPLGDHYRTRLTHTLEVSEIARTIARAMRLNEDLTEAIAMGHDLGHTPFGHGGEMALKEIFSEDFAHNEQSLRVVDLLEHRGAGLNLSYEVRDGILKHSKGFGTILPTDACEMPHTLEGAVVRLSDVMAYLNHDLDDAVRSRVISPDQIPLRCVETLGSSHSVRVTTMIHDLVFTSREESGAFCLRFSKPVDEAMLMLRSFLYDNVYRSPKVHSEFVKAKKILVELFLYLLDRENVAQFRRCLADLELSSEPEKAVPDRRSVCDLVASMTDRYALDLYKSLFFPTPRF
ncbi:MAG: deoxyguanosinetriphosphate triphosphohydrolase [Deltaproteobacteria bacterium]|nr:deoxyguanosinetriphosphate triphosphohydrolase [Deltaproteobacteria bacterium]